MKKGKVYLVGAGPGDPGLITKRGIDLIDRCDVIVIDALVNPILLRTSRAEIIYVGKRGPGAPKGRSIVLSQKKINQLLIRLAKKGKRVVRLKGGDPLVFGRGSEEMEALHAARIPFEIVPGVTSAIAVPAYAGIPVSDRRWSSHVTFLTGQESKGVQSKTSNIDWSTLKLTQTLVILMGVNSWPGVRKKLLKAGWPRSKPVAAIENGTTASQRILLTTLFKSKADFKKKKLVAPTILVVGEVSKLTRILQWVKKEKPLLGKRVVVTRAEFQASTLVDKLEEKGAEVLLCPSIQIEPLFFHPLVRHMVSLLKNKSVKYDWIVFLSANAVRIFYSALQKNSISPPAVKIFAVGPRTRNAIEKLGGKVTRQAKVFNSKGVLSQLGPVRNKRILIPRVEGGPKAFVHALQKRGAVVQEVPVYRNVSAAPPTDTLKKLILNGVQAVTFTSGSTVRRFMTFFTPYERKAIFSKAKAVSIGPTTTSVLKEFSVSKPIQATQATIDQVVEILGRKIGSK